MATHTEYRSFRDRAMARVAEQHIVLDVGGGARFQKWLAPYAHLFVDADYRTLDYDANTGADVVGDIHDLPLETGSIDAIICSSVLEHVQNPERAVIEMHRVLRTGGTFYGYVPSIYPYHARKGSYPDYWRFFDDTLEVLFEPFGTLELQKVGGYFKALSYFVPLQHKLRGVLDPLADFCDRLLGERTTTSGYMIYAVK